MGEIIRHAVPLGQLNCLPSEATRSADLGLGLAYYALARILRPKHIVVIGSYRGFSVVCFALALRDNGLGRVHLIDASRVDAFWSDAQRAKQHFSRFGVASLVSIYNMPSARCAQTVSPFRDNNPFIDILLLDADHSKKGVTTDVAYFGALVREGGFLCFHDSCAGGVGKTPFQVAEYLATLDVELYESITLEIAKGLTLVRKLPAVEMALDIQRRRREVVSTLADLAGCTDLPTKIRFELRRLKRSMEGLLAAVKQKERLFAARHRYLSNSAAACRKQITDLKKELRLLRSTGVAIEGTAASRRRRNTE
ncbi:MAG: class I SAM-dependent methyltransferase [Planctomycetes bacterium]|nr:class I SAM-dependent methyltransferase [Planctomycetota bacterium]MBI3843281.1 class I SAM-dependent methyltransferase [Planctomycetota bacterium]